MSRPAKVTLVGGRRLKLQDRANDNSLYLDAILSDIRQGDGLMIGVIALRMQYRSPVLIAEELFTGRLEFPVLGVQCDHVLINREFVRFIIERHANED